MFAWRRQARDGELPIPVDDGAAFAPLVVDEAEMASPGIAADTGVIEIVLADVAIRVPLDIAPRRLAAIVQALQAGS